MSDVDVNRAIDNVNAAMTSLKHAGSNLARGAASIEVGINRLQVLREALGEGPEFESIRLACDEIAQELEGQARAAREAAERASKSWQDIDKKMVGIW